MTYDPGSPGGRPQPPGGQGWPGGQQQPYPAGYGQQPPPGWGPPAGGPQPGGTPSPQRNVLAALLDFSFTSFATPGLVRLLYVVGSVLLLFSYLGYVVYAFGVDAVFGFVALVVGAVVVLFWLALLRVLLEFYSAVVRMSEDIHNRR